MVGDRSADIVGVVTDDDDRTIADVWSEGPYMICERVRLSPDRGVTEPFGSDEETCDTQVRDLLCHDMVAAQ
ncbi:hypothetical protein OG478_13495 [Streptomyces phaeochromogenes]|nr:hypothetical protein OG478_13495 [Streptomyces phaeochromogenes]